MSIQPFEPFRIDVPQATLDDLRARLAATRAQPAREVADWDAGASPAFIDALVEHWRTTYDWRAREAELNRWAQFRARVAGTTVHFIHERGRGDAPLPLVLTHGFPDSFLRFAKLIPLLTDPAAHGGDADDAFDVVVPSLPGFAFSDGAASIFQIGDLWHALMTGTLGYGRFGAHGGDWGSTISEHLGRSHAASVVGIHLTDIPFWHSFQPPKDVSPGEQAYLTALEQYQMRHGAYAMIQGTRPQTLADGLNDSPAGLAAWIVDKFQRWSDCDGDVERCFSKDELLTNVMIYWVTGTIGSSFRPYHDVVNATVPRWILEKAKELVGSSKVPAGFALFPKDLSHPPREWAQRFFNVQRWTEFPKGGHFAAMEQPQALAEDMRDFFRPLRSVQ